MRAMQIIQRQFESDLPGVHRARMRLVFAAVFSALRCGQLSLTSLGRAVAERTTHKHGIKRIDRLFGNTHLHDERLLFYAAIARRIIAPGSSPPIIVDWTAITPKFWALVAAVSFHGRAITVYAETHQISRYMKPQVNAAFVRRLKAVLPRGCAPVILADAGFRAPFMRLVQDLGWDYVVRVRGTVFLRQRRDRDWKPPSVFFELTGTRPKDFDHVEMSRQGPFTTRLVGWRRRIHHRKYHSVIRHSVADWRERRAAHEPWLLATSLTVESSRVVALYARRMQIEETFRDTKNPRFGMSLVHARPTREDRADVLLLLGSLAHLCALLLGIAAEAAKLDRGYQANTLVSRRVLSLVTIGRLVFNSGNELVLAAAFEERAWETFRRRVRVGLDF